MLKPRVVNMLLPYHVSIFSTCIAIIWLFGFYLALLLVVNEFKLSHLLWV